MKPDRFLKLILPALLLSASAHADLEKIRTRILDNLPPKLRPLVFVEATEADILQRLKDAPEKDANGLRYSLTGRDMDTTFTTLSKRVHRVHFKAGSNRLTASHLLKFADKGEMIRVKDGYDIPGIGVKIHFHETEKNKTMSEIWIDAPAPQATGTAKPAR